MKYKIYIAILVCCTFSLRVKAQAPPIDTMNVLNINIIQNASNFIGQPLVTLLDTLASIGLGSSITEYTRDIISDDAYSGTIPGDTVWTDRMILHIGNFYFSQKGKLRAENPGMVVHLPAIYVRFTTRIPFPNFSYTNTTDFNSILYLVSPAIVKEVKILEY